LKQNDSYLIGVAGLKLGKHVFDWTVNESLLKANGVDYLRGVDVQCVLELEKKTRLMQLEFQINGSMVTDCDRCGDEMGLTISMSNKLVVRFAEESDFNDDEVIFLAESEHQLEVGQFIYEFIMTGLPARFVHKKGLCNPDVEAFLAESTQEEEQKEEIKENIDPRWEVLKKLKTKD
jgi:uncharacterized metal-binding protein YceD (DUF177 family)